MVDDRTRFAIGWLLEFDELAVRVPDPARP
jgi:hypothetical protein